MTDVTLTPRQREILECIEQSMRERGYPPSVREIGEAVGLTSPSTVHNHLATLQRLGFLRRDPTKPRAIEVRFDAQSGAPVERRPVRHVPLVGDVAAGTDVLAQENIEETHAGPGRPHRRRRPVHAAGPGRLDDRRRHPRRRLRGRPGAADRRAGRHRGGRHPRRGGHGQDLQPQGRQGHPRSRPTPASSPWSSTPTRSRSSARSSPCCVASDRGRAQLARREPVRALSRQWGG